MNGIFLKLVKGFWGQISQVFRVHAKHCTLLKKKKKKKSVVWEKRV